MTDLKLVIRTVGLAAAVIWVAGTAKAQPISDYTIGSGGLEAFNLQIDGTTDSSALAGGILLDKTSGVGPASFASICTDISGTVYLGYNYGYQGPVVFQGQTGLDPTWGAGNASGLNNSVNAAAAIQAAADIFYKYGYVLTSGTTDQRAGLQLAVWAALYNTAGGATPSTSLDGSRFSVLGTSSATWSGSWGSTSAGTSTAISDAQTYLAAVNFNDLYSGSLMIPDPHQQYGLTAQEMLVSVTPVPEPTTMIAGALLLLPFAASTVRLRKNRAA
jgi:hypothetical protein